MWGCGAALQHPGPRSFPRLCVDVFCARKLRLAGLFAPGRLLPFALFYLGDAFLFSVSFLVILSSPLYRITFTTPEQTALSLCPRAQALQPRTPVNLRDSPVVYQPPTPPTPPMLRMPQLPRRSLQFDQHRDPLRLHLQVDHQLNSLDNKQHLPTASTRSLARTASNTTQSPQPFSRSASASLSISLSAFPRRKHHIDQS